MIKQKNFKQGFQSIASIFNGKYTCSCQIGQGAYSKVYLGENQEKKCVAIKVIDLTKLQQEEIVYQKNEIQILKQIHECENVIRMLDFAEANQNIFIVLEEINSFIIINLFSIICNASKQLRNANVLFKQFQGKYKIVKYIGQGSFSKVFKCVDSEFKKVALKVINAKEQSQYVIKNYLENERKILEQARDCDNVVKLIEYAQSKDQIFIVLEYCQFDLDHVRRQFFNSKITEDIAIIIFRQIANGLAQLHKHRIMHRDLKLENIAVVLIDVDLLKITENDFRSATYKLIDFGLSKLLNDIDKTNTFIGTPATMGIKHDLQNT